METQPTKTDELVLLMNTLGSAADPGMTLDAIIASTGWSHRKTVERILDLGGKVGKTKIAAGKLKGLYYFMKVD